MPVLLPGATIGEFNGGRKGERIVGQEGRREKGRERGRKHRNIDMWAG